MGPYFSMDCSAVRHSCLRVTRDIEIGGSYVR
jgi:hypothetical protein